MQFGKLDMLLKSYRETIGERRIMGMLTIICTILKLGRKGRIKPPLQYPRMDPKKRMKTGQTGVSLW
jgi:hypothetical protein